jgi:hypothetical protein
MATAGDDFLRNMLGDSENTPLTMSNTTTGGSGQPTPPPPVPAAQRDDQAQADIDAETRRIRDQEMQRVENGPPSFWESISPVDPSQAGSGGGGASGPGGYKFDAETIAAKITSWEQVRDAIRDDETKLRQAAQYATPPSGDQPAAQQVDATRNSINACADHNLKMQQYAQAYIDQLRKANGTYVQHEESASDSFNGGTSGTGSLYS